MNCIVAALAALFLTGTATAQTQQPIKVAIVGLTHGHIKGFLHNLPTSKSATLVAIVEPNQSLAEQYRTQYKLDPSLFYSDEETMLNKVHPDAVLGYGTIAEHRKVIEVAAKHGVNSMVEKPLSTTVEDALAIRDAARKNHVQVLVNYETTWYNSNAEALKEIKSGQLGDVRKVLVRDGHVYTRTEDDATVIVAYPGMQAILMPSWDWSFAVKNMEVYGNKGEIFTDGPGNIVTRYKGQKVESAVYAAPQLPQNQSNSLDYLAAVLHHDIDPKGDLSSLETNLVVVQILDAARTSIKEGKTIALKPLP